MNRYEIQLRISKLQIMRWRLFCQGNTEGVRQIDEIIAEHLQDLKM